MSKCLDATPAFPTAGNYTANADSTVTVISMQLTRHKFKTVHLTARESAETAFNVLDALVLAAAKQLAQDVLQDIFGEITAANYGAPVIAALAAADFDYKKVLAIREACSAVKMPVTDRSLILDGAYYTNLLGDDIVAKRVRAASDAARRRRSANPPARRLRSA